MRRSDISERACAWITRIDSEHGRLRQLRYLVGVGPVFGTCGRGKEICPNAILRADCLPRMRNAYLYHAIVARAQMNSALRANKNYFALQNVETLFKGVHMRRRFTARRQARNSEISMSGPVVFANCPPPF